MAEQILVTGATGAVGPRVVQALHEAGHKVRTLSLDTPTAGVFPDGVQVCIGDVTDQATVKSVMQEIKVVVHLAALLHAAHFSRVPRQEYERINVGGTNNVVNAAVGSAVRRIVFFSTIAVYGSSNNIILTEDSIPRPDTSYALTKLAAERSVLDASCADGQSMGTVLRLGAIYGTRVKGNYRSLLRALARGRFIPIGNGCNRRSLIYDKDVASATVLAAQYPLAAGKIFNVTDGQIHTLNEIIAAMCNSLGRTAPRVSLPAGPVRLVAGLVEDGMRLVGRASPINRATVDKYTEDMAVSCQRIQTQLGFRPKFDLASGWLETVQEMRRMRDL